MSEQSLDAIEAAGARAWAGADRRCGTCRWCGEDRSGDRVCRRHAPQVTGRNQVRYTEWPCVITTRDWCGEWAATPEAWGDSLATLPATVTEANADEVAARIVAFHAEAGDPVGYVPDCIVCGKPVSAGSAPFAFDGSGKFWHRACVLTPPISAVVTRAASACGSSPATGGRSGA